MPGDYTLQIAPSGAVTNFARLHGGLGGGVPSGTSHEYSYGQDYPQNKILVVCCDMASGSRVTGVDIGGATGVLVAEVPSGVDGYSLHAYEATPGAANGGVVTITTSGSHNRVACDVFDVQGLSHVADDSVAMASGGDVTFSANTNAGDTLISVLTNLFQQTFTHPAGWTEHQEGSVFGDLQYCCASYDGGAAGGSPESVTHTISATQSRNGLLLVYR